jgi:hypothetical protein
MATPRLSAPVLASLLLAGCAHLGELGKKDEPRYREEVVMDVDLTTGSAGPGQVTGGRFDGGWRVTSRKGDRIVFDAGRPLEAGYLEVAYTMAKPPHAPPAAKIEWVGLYEEPALSQEKSSGDIFYVRAGDPDYKYGRVKAYGRKFDKTEWENDVGRVEDWVTDDRTVQTVRLEWKQGRAIFHDPHGKAHACSKKLCSPKYPIDHLRYAVLGSDLYTGVSLEGIRFLHVKLVSYLPEGEPRS